MMNAKPLKSLWLTPVCLIASIGSSLLVVWLLSSWAGFTFNPSVVAVLSAAVCAAAMAIEHRRKGG